MRGHTGAAHTSLTALGEKLHSDGSACPVYRPPEGPAVRERQKFNHHVRVGKNTLLCIPNSESSACNEKMENSPCCLLVSSLPLNVRIFSVTSMGECERATERA